MDGDCGNQSSGCEQFSKPEGKGSSYSDEEEDDDEDDDCDSDYSEDSPFGPADTAGPEATPRIDSASRAANGSAVGGASSAGQTEEHPMTPYEADPSAEVFGTAGDQTEEISDENKSIVWFLVKQVRPGMDLSKVVLPTFILEPRSFLDKLSDYYYHADLLSQ